ncbi:hypothetical protein Vadar_004920 [Vaccinium darrowii]|uniref:Uncharacterized protein n=1 Tax=Vaccinium darrowii TaxID=229202 RepID=A0ACB7Z2L3_9ERIC|nr:hypothetical protein Vadar_004920 [Vaccinium darrowii]
MLIWIPTIELLLEQGDCSLYFPPRALISTLLPTKLDNITHNTYHEFSPKYFRNFILGLPKSTEATTPSLMTRMSTPSSSRSRPASTCVVGGLGGREEEARAAREAISDFSVWKWSGVGEERRGVGGNACRQD